jgi:hypothetical protein
MSRKAFTKLQAAITIATIARATRMCGENEQKNELKHFDIGLQSQDA